MRELVGLLLLQLSVLGTNANLKFSLDILEHVGARYPVLISKEGYDDDLSNLPLNIPTTYASYEVNKEEDKIVNLLNELKHAGYLSWVVFLDDGHTQLLKTLVNEYQLFRSKISGLCQDGDLSSELLNLKLDTQLYYYIQHENGTELRETYLVNEVLSTNNLGLWKEGTEPTNLYPNIANIWKRRTSFHGLTVNVASINRKNLHEIYYYGNPMEYRPPKTRVEGKAVIGGGGIFLEPLNILSASLNFTLNLTASIDNKYGGVDANGKWNGMIGMVVRGEVDLAAASLTRTMERDAVTSFSITIMDEFSTLATPVGGKPAIQVWVYMKIFSPTSWAIISAALICIATCLYVINASGLSKLHGTHDSEDFNIQNGIGLSMLFLMQLHYDIRHSTLSSRIVILMCGITFYLIHAYYVSDLTASMTSKPRGHTVKSFNDVIKGDYKILVKDATAQFSQLKSSAPGSAKYQVYQDQIKSNPKAFVTNPAEAIEVMKEQYKTLYFVSSTAKFLDDKLKFLQIEVSLMLLALRYEIQSMYVS